MPYDLFVSYSRKDNERGQPVTALKEQIEADYRIFAGEELRCFFDVDAIASMDDWRHRILQALSESNILLLVLSPAYLDSPYCEWEIVEFLKYEHARSVAGQGVSPVYFVEIPGLDDPDFELRAASWVARVRRRNHADLRPWFEEGRGALERREVRNRLNDLERSLHARLTRLRRLRNAPGNLPAHNPRFVGREAEMQRLHESVALGRFGVLTAVQGVGGLGKTALAIQYACAYADFYPGGRWLVGCAGRSSLAAAVRGLDLDLGIAFDQSEKRDDVRAARRILVELERRAVEGASARAGEKEASEAKTLLLLDNVDSAKLLQPPESDLISGRPWLRVLATTRLGADELGGDVDNRALLTIDELPEANALRLIESYQPEGRFCNGEERDAALGLVRLLGGFTLAVEVVALYLGERAGRVTCGAFLARMEKEGLGGLDDGVGRQIRGGLRHGEKLLGPTLRPTLDLLSEPERLVLTYAALLPPDTIPLPWLRALVGAAHPDLAHDAEPGYEDPWLSIVNHLLGLRLLQVLDFDPETRSPRLVRMHRVVGEVVRTGFGAVTCSQRLQTIVTYGLKRSSHLEEHWFEAESKWEIAPLMLFTEQLLEDENSNAPELVKYVGQWSWAALGEWARFESIHRRAIELLERSPRADERELAILSSNLGGGLVFQGRYREAESLLRKALDADERLREHDHPFIFIRLNNLGLLLENTGAYGEAEQLFRRALAGRERVFGPDHPRTLWSANNLGSLLVRTGAYAEAERLLRRALAGCERVLGPQHPSTLRSVASLGVLFESTGAYGDAEPLFRRALAGSERVFGPEHPETLTSVHNLASLLSSTGAFGEAEPLHWRALAGRERVLGPEHPDTVKNLDDLADLLEKTGRLEEARPLRVRQIEQESRRSDVSPQQLRQMALSCVKLRDYALAEKLLQRVLAQGFELPSTYLHLARIAVLTDRDAEAREHVNQAWERRAGAAPHVPPRILFFQVLFAFLGGADAQPALGRLKQALSTEEAHMEWTMQPVLDHLRPRVSDETHALLTALVAALSERADLAALNSFPAWRDATPIAGGHRACAGD